MTLGEFLDAVEQEAARRGIELDRVDWTHSRNLDNLRIGGRRIGDVEQGRVAIIRREGRQMWTNAHARKVVKEVMRLLEVTR